LNEVYLCKKFSVVEEKNVFVINMYVKS